MTHTPIRPAPVGRARPEITDQAVLSAAIEVRRQGIRDWMWDMPEVPDKVTEAMDHAIGSALRTGKLDGFNAAVVLAKVFGYPADQKLVSLLAEVVSAIPCAHREATRRWVVETGYRVPAKAGDDIAWIGADGMPREGRVSLVAPEMAAAYVVVGDLADPASLQSEDEDGQPLPHVRVLGETIFANISQARYDLETPTLGQTYAPDVVAQAVQDAEAEFLAGKAQTGASSAHLTTSAAPASPGAEAPSSIIRLSDVFPAHPEPAKLNDRSAAILPFTKIGEPTRPVADPVEVAGDPKVVHLNRRLPRAGDPPPKIVVAPNGDVVIDSTRRIIDALTVKTPVKDVSTDGGPPPAPLGAA